METAKLTDFFVQFWFLDVKTENLSKALNLIARLNKSREYFEESY